jgi:hypothetical protein
MSSITHVHRRKTDVDGYVLQSRGLIVNVNEDEYNDYKRRQVAMGQKESEICSLKDRLCHLETKLDVILTAIKGKTLNV